MEKAPTDTLQFTTEGLEGLDPERRARIVNEIRHLTRYLVEIGEDPIASEMTAIDLLAPGKGDQ